MRVSIALVVVGEIGGLIAIAGWSWQLSLLLFSLQCIGLGLLRESQDRATRQPGARGAHRPPRRRRWTWRRPKLRLLRGGVAS